MGFLQWWIGEHAVPDIDARLLPPSLYRPFREYLHGRNLAERETAKEFQVHHLGKIRLDLRHFLQYIVDRQQLPDVNCLSDQVRLERSNFELAAVLEGAVLPGVVDDQPPHHPRGISHETSAIREHGPVGSRHIEVSLV